MRWLTLTLLLAAITPLPAQAEDGLFGWGFRLELGIGPVEAAGPGGVALGAVQHLGFQYGLHPRWALRFEGSLSRGIEDGKASWGQGAVAGTAVYRFLDDRARFRPSVGGGLRVGALVGSRELLGLGASTDPNLQSFLAFPLSPLVVGVLEWRLGKALGLMLVADAAVVFFSEGPVWHLSQRLVLALRL